MSLFLASVVVVVTVSNGVAVVILFLGRALCPVSKCNFVWLVKCFESLIFCWQKMFHFSPPLWRWSLCQQPLVNGIFDVHNDLCVFSAREDEGEIDAYDSPTLSQAGIKPTLTAFIILCHVPVCQTFHFNTETFLQSWRAIRHAVWTLLYSHQEIIFLALVSCCLVGLSSLKISHWRIRSLNGFVLCVCVLGQVMICCWMVMLNQWKARNTQGQFRVMLWEPVWRGN